MESIFELALSGNGYEAVERSQFLVRKLKKEEKLDEAMFFLMRLAQILSTHDQWKPATVVANRAIKLFPSDSKTIKVALKSSFINFVESATEEASSIDFYEFSNSLISIIGDKDLKILKKQLNVSYSSKDYFRTHYFLILMLEKIKENQISDIEPNSIIDQLSQSTWEWILNEKIEEQQIFTSQFIISRICLSLLSFKDLGISYSRQFIEIISQNLPLNLNKSILNLPLLNFINFFIKSLELKNSENIDMLINKYKPILDMDPEIMKWINFIKNNILNPSNSNQQGPNFRSILQNLMGNLFTPPPNN